MYSQAYTRFSGIIFQIQDHGPKSFSGTAIYYDYLLELSWTDPASATPYSTTLTYEAAATP